MMDSFKIYTRHDIDTLVNVRVGEEKLGQKVQVIASLDQLQQATARLVLLGIPEDIGVRANFGVAGAKTAWASALKAFLNIQSNQFLQGDEVLVLGHFEIEETSHQDIAQLRTRVAEIDKLVEPVIAKLVECGKIPIVIGGGHNNALPIISGVSKALKQKINVVNIDAHADVREVAEGRHSGNGFSNAIANGFLNEYCVFGLHQSYVSKSLLAYMLDNQVKTTYFEDMLLNEQSIKDCWINFTADLQEPCGLEIDLDSIERVLSSAISPSGFALNDIRKILLSNRKKFSYLHLCEGAIALADGRTDLSTGKTIAYLLSDAVKALLPRTFQQP